MKTTKFYIADYVRKWGVGPNDPHIRNFVIMMLQKWRDHDNARQLVEAFANAKTDMARGITAAPTMFSTGQLGWSISWSAVSPGGIRLYVFEHDLCISLSLKVIFIQLTDQV